MSDAFASQLSAFKKTLKSSSTTLPAQRRIVKPTTPAATEASPVKNVSPIRQTAKRPISALSNSADTRDEDDDDEEFFKRSKSSNSASLSIRLMNATDYIRGSDRPIPLEELEKHMKERIDSQLLKVISTVDRISYDPVSRCFEYLSLHNIKTGDDLVKVLKNQPTFQGLGVKQLRDGWNGCLETIAKLEAENKIIVHRTKKDNTPRHIWINAEEIPLGGIVDEEFVNMWNHIKIPKGDDLVQTLLDNDLTPTSIDPNSIQRKAAPTQEKRQKKPRRGKVTNIHMKGILKDYF